MKAPTHTGDLRALPGEEPRHLPLELAGCAVQSKEPFELRGDLFAGVRGHHEPMKPRRLGRSRTRAGRRVAPALKPCRRRAEFLRERGGLPHEPLGRGRRQAHRARHGLVGGLEHDVRVRPAESERADSGEPPSIDGLPRLERGLHADAQRVEVDVRVRLPKVEARGQHPVVHGQRHLDEPRDAGRGLEVTDVRLDRADAKRPIRRPFLAEYDPERAGFDRVAQHRPRAVCFDVLDVGGGDLRVGAGVADHRLLSPGARSGEAVAESVVVESRSADGAVDAVSVGDRVREPLQRDDAAALSRGAYPLARASNALERPSGAIAPNFVIAMVLSGDRSKFTPPANARRDSPRSRLCRAR